MQKRRDNLMAYIKRRQERKEGNNKFEDDEDHPNYSYHDWLDELEQHRFLLKDAIYEACSEKNLDFDTTWKEYWANHVASDKLEQREIAIQEWFLEHGLDHKLDPDIRNREDYIWWYSSLTNKQKKAEKNKRNQIAIELAALNKKKEALDKRLRPWV